MSHEPVEPSQAPTCSACGLPGGLRLARNPHAPLPPAEPAPLPLPFERSPGAESQLTWQRSGTVVELRGLLTDDRPTQLEPHEHLSKLGLSPTTSTQAVDSR